jgi:hypothetical protein
MASKAVFGIGGAKPVQRGVSLANILKLLGQRIAEQELCVSGGRLANCRRQPLGMIAIRRLLAQAGQQMVRTGIAGEQREQGFERRFGIIDPAEEVQCRRKVVAVLGALRNEPDGLFEVRQGGGVIAQPGIDAAHGIAAEGIGGRRPLCRAHGVGSIALAADEREQLGELGLILAPRRDGDGTADMFDAGIDTTRA